MRLTALWVGLLVVASAALLGPVTALADEREWHKPKPPKDSDAATVYEVAEWASFIPPKGTQRRRLATATLVGTVEAGSTFCPEKLDVSFCNLTILASNNISLTSGLGPVEGDFWVVSQDTNGVDGPEVIILKGRLFHATIDLGPAFFMDIPIGSLSGRWEARGTTGGPLDGYKVDGDVTGMFQLPFVIPGVIDVPSYAVNPALFPNEGCCQDIQPDETSLGAFTVRLQLTLIPRK